MKTLGVLGALVVRAAVVLLVVLCAVMFRASKESVVTDPAGNVKGDAGRRFSDIVQASQKRQDDGYVLGLTTLKCFPLPQIDLRIDEQSNEIIFSSAA